MNANLGQPTAKIYQFPLHAVRRSGELRRGDVRTLTRFDAASQPVVDYEGAWYHAEAIAEERRDRKQ